MIVAATLAPASAQLPHGNATKRGRSVVTAEVVKPAKRLVAVAVAPSQPVPATVVAAAKPRACVVAVRSSACTSVATATREEQAERLEQQLERLREEQQRRRQAEQARGQVVHQAVQLREEAASAHAAVQAAARLLPSHYREVFLRRCSALRPQPSRVPRLTLEPTTQRLGAGTFGDVFQSRLRGGTPVAVKVPKAVTARSLFVEEVSLLLNLRHKHVVQAYGVSETGALVMELCGLGTLEALLSSGSPFSDSAMARGVAQGIAYIHSQKVFHCDLKPSNILVTEGLEPKLADFGLSLVGSSLLTPLVVEHEQDRPRGTCTFRAPEVLSGGAFGRRRYRLAAADVWSLACVMACIGRRSKRVYEKWGSDRASGEEAERRVAAGQLRPSLPAAHSLAEVVERASAHDPAHRATAESVANALL